MIRSKFGIAALVLVFVPLFGCEPDAEVEGPEAVFRGFVEDIWRGNEATALESIAPQTRARLLEPLREVEAIFDDAQPLKSTDMLIVTRLDNPHELEEVEVVGEIPEPLVEGARVELALRTLDDREGEAAMVYQDGRWYVDLPLDQVDTEQTLVPIEREGDGSEEEQEASGEPSDAPAVDAADEQVEEDGKVER